VTAAALPGAARPLVLSDLLPGALVRDAALVLGGAALVGLAAQVSTPLPGTRCRPASPPDDPAIEVVGAVVGAVVEPLAVPLADLVTLPR